MSEKLEEKKKTADQKLKKPRKRKWSAGEPIPIEMPENSIMKGIAAEIEQITVNEALRLKNKEKIALNLFIITLVSSIIFLTVWLFANAFSFIRDVQTFRAAGSFIEVISLSLILEAFNFYSEKDDWKTRRKKSIIIWMLALFSALSLLSLFVKF